MVSYNAKDLDDIREILHPDLTFIHHGMMHLSSADSLSDLQSHIATVFEDRQWDLRYSCANENTVMTQSTWRGTAGEDVPWVNARSGQRVTIDYCTVFSFDDLGQVTRWEDYGTPVLEAD